MVEIGGTVGDIESLPFMEASRQFMLDHGHGNSLLLHLTYIPFIKASNELKTKPTQHSVKMLMEYGLRPDILICRSEYKLTKDEKNKLALFCNVEYDSVVEALDVDHTIYEVPINFAKSEIAKIERATE